MKTDLAGLYAELDRAPEDWSIRIRLVEAASARGDLAEARRLVRASPDEDRYLPAELQDRIHALLTGAGGGLLCAAALLLAGCAATGAGDGFAGTKPRSDLIESVRSTTRAEGLATAKRALLAGLAAEDDSGGDLQRRVVRTTADADLVLPDSLAALPAARRARVALAIVPGTKAANPNGKDRTRECLRGAAEVSAAMGFATHFIETEARGAVEENAALVAARMREVFARSDRVILVMLSKGAHDVIRYLQEDGIDLPPADRAKLSVVLSLAGTVQGSVVADWMAHSPRPLALATRRWLRLSGQDAAIDMLESVARSPWDERTAWLLPGRFPQLTWISIAMAPDGEDGRITEHLWAPMVRSRIERTMPYYSPSDGLVESAASVLPDAVEVPEWVVIGSGSHAMPNGAYLGGGRIAPRTTRPGKEKLRPESGGEIMSAYLRALPQSLLR